MKAREDDSEGFVMVFTDEAGVSVIGALRDRKLNYRDLSVLFALLAHVNWRSGRAYVTQQALADGMGMNKTTCSEAVKRLQRERLVARMKDGTTGMTYFLISPRLAAVGSPQRRAHLTQQFDDAFGDLAA